MPMEANNCEREYDFALILGGKNELTTEIENGLFEAGCDDATFSVQYGSIYAEFSRTAPSLKDAVLSAIRDIHKAGVGVEVVRVDECNLVTPADIARRIQRSRQLVHQYMSGQRGPGAFPPPVYYLAENAPLWAWCEVSYWFAKNDILRPEDGWNAEVLCAINNWLEAATQKDRNPDLVQEIAQELAELS